jgi:cephalosporin-C deacetylase-like acetyl esterase
VNYSELDINLLPPAGRGADPAVANPYANGLPDEKQQALAKRYADIFGVIVKHHDWIGRVTFWGLSDADSWLNRGRANYPLLWDRQRQPKPAFQAIVDVLRQARASAAPPRPPIVQQLTFAPYHANGIYGVGETVGWTVTPGPTPPTYAYTWTIRRNNAVVLKTGELDLSGGSAKIEIVADQPEMLYVAVEAHANLDPNAAAPQAGESPRFIGGNTGRNTGFYAVGAAVAPREIGLSTPRPADFDTFWNTKLAAQANVPINPALTPVTTDVPGVDMNIFQLDALGSKAHGYVAKPAKDGKFPALIQLQYAGVYALNAHADAQRAAEGWLMLNVDSHDKLPSDPSGGVPRGYQAVGNTDRETSYFLDMYLRDSRVLDYLLTRPDWDGKTIVLTGGSMGGQQSMTLAGLRPDKISAVLVCVPAGADTNGDLHGRKAGYPNWPSDNPAAMRTALYFDPVNFASHITAPVMAGMGFIDTISPPAGVWTMLNQVRGPVETFPLIESEHDNLTPDKARPCSAHVSEILDRIVHGATFAPAASK